MPLFDTHAHLTSPQLAADLNQIIEQAAQQDLSITSIGTDLSSSRACLELADRFPKVYAAVGIHPNDCHQATDADWDQIQVLAQQQQVVAIGETGLDRYWDTVPIQLQREWFARHIELSFQTNKPLVIHLRDCDDDLIQMLDQHQQNGRIIGILHSFAGRWATAERALELGMYISFAGMVTFKKSDKLRAIAAKIPDDRILVETDSPYLSPHPKRNIRPNQPAMVQYTADCLAAVRQTSAAAFARQTTDNAKRVFNLRTD